MRIALFHNLPSGGAKRSVFEWLKRLSSSHNIDVYTLSSADHYYYDIRPFVVQHHVTNFVPRRLFKSPLGRLNQFQRWHDLGKLTRIGQSIAEEINKGDYDIVFAQPCLYSYIPSILQFVQIPVIYYLHEPIGQMFTRQIQRPYIKKNKWREFLNQIDPLLSLYNLRLKELQLKSINRTEGFLANSKFTRNQMEKEFNIDAPVCYLGVDYICLLYTSPSPRD